MLLAKYTDLPLYTDLFSIKQNTTLYNDLFSIKQNTTVSTVHCYCAQNSSRSESAQQLHFNAQVSKYSK